jgi:hypothetical protein
LGLAEGLACLALTDRTFEVAEATNHFTICFFVFFLTEASRLAASFGGNYMASFVQLAKTTLASTLFCGS